MNAGSDEVPKTKVLFILPGMSAGGAERVMLNLLTNLPRRQFDLSLVLMKDGGEFLAKVPGDVKIFILKTKRLRYVIPKLINLIWRQKIDVVFPTLGGLNRPIMMLKWLFPPQTRVVIRETIAMSGLMKYNVRKQSTITLIKWLYPKADSIISLCKYMVADLEELTGISFKNQQVIYNPVDIIGIKINAACANPFSGKGLNIVAAGRLDRQKGYERLIKAFPALLEKKPEAHLWILGEGQLRGSLENLIEEMGLWDRIHLPGYQDNPYKWIRNADLFVLSSLYEGLPNILLEAIACSCPVVSLENPGGALEILEMTGQPERYVKELTWDDWWFECPGPEIITKLEEHFGMEKIVAQYSEVLK